MKKKIVSTILSAAILASSCSALMPTAFAEAKVPQYQTAKRQMEELNRGLVAVKTTADTRGQTVDGVYLSWRLLGDESLTNQAFDIYRDDVKIYTTGPHDATCYIDTAGTATSQYKVSKAGVLPFGVKGVTPIATNHYAKPSEVGNGNSLKNSFTYIDIPIERPADEKSLGGDMSYYYNLDSSHEGGANDASVGDLDGDGDYEIVLKWDPTNSKDAASSGYSGRVYIDAYEIDPELTAGENGHLYTWRIDLGQNIRAGAHDTQILVYDFDGDGKSEVAMQTALGSKDGNGEFVTKVGDTEEIRAYTDEENNTEYTRKGHNIGPDFYTVFDGETGAALCTTAGIPLGREDGGDWGDSKMQRSHRFLGAVAYIDGVHPSIVMCRGYYNKAVVRSYTWDGSEMTLQWEHNGATDTLDSLYGQGNHNLSVADVDNDGKDEIVYGSAVLDDDGKVIGNTRLNHGDAMHVSDFNNDGTQEVFSVKEKSVGTKNNAADFRVAATGQNIFGKGASGDTGRGVMDNIDDAYAKENPNALALGWTSSHDNVFDLTGAELNAKPSGAGKGSFDNFLVYWDGDLGRELLDANIIQKYDAANGWTKRFYGPSDGYTLTGASTNNYTKRTPCLVADLFGDWREEIVMATGKGKDESPALRIFMTTLPTEYRLTTLMHDSQYRMSVAWQNVAYNQPTHTSYYIGSAALATDENGNELNYLAPATPYTNVVYELENVPVTGVSIEPTEVSVEKTKSVSVKAIVEPEDATKKTIVWTSSDESIATVSNGIIKGVSEGTATITATTRDGGFEATCAVTVYADPVKGISLAQQLVEMGIGYQKALSATVYPSDATDTSIKWTSSDNTVATVASDGTVTGVGYGRAVITATTNDGGFTDTCIVRVKPYEESNINSEDSFISTTNTDDFTGTATSGKFSLSNSTNSVNEFHKDFEPYSQSKVTLQYHFVTGGTKLDGSNWNWDGHEYSFAVKMLDTEGNNMLTMSQAYTSSGQTLMSKVGSSDATGLINSWTKVVDGAGYVQGSAKRWIVTVVLDYDNDKATVTLIGTDGNWTAENANYTTSFSLNGQSFKTLQCEITKDGDGGVTANPDLNSVTYTSTVASTGNAENLYRADTQTADNIADWTLTGVETADLEFDSDNNRILYNPTKPGAEYNASKTFDIVENALVTYDVDWYFGSAVGRDNNFEYIQFGNNLRIGWTNGYVTWVSTDGGLTWNDLDGDETPDSIFTGANETYNKNVNVVFDTQSNTIKSLKFGGSDVTAYAGYAMPEGSTYDAMSFGFQRSGEAPNWAVPNGINSVKVSQFVYGDEPVEVAYVALDGVEGNTANISYAIVDDVDSAVIIAAVYNADGNLTEVKMNNLDGFEKNKDNTTTITFDNALEGCSIELFMWDGTQNLSPLCD